MAIKASLHSIPPKKGATATHLTYMKRYRNEASKKPPLLEPITSETRIKTLEEPKTVGLL